MKEFNGFRLSDEEVSRIRELKNQKLEASKSEMNMHFNEVLREDILSLLDKLCVVIYYPTEDANNNGFHVCYPFNGKDIHFVYINTAQDREKQIFTAAHELGHFWEIDKKLINEFGTNGVSDYEEKVVSRFASELLMPYDIFGSFFKSVYNDEKYPDEITAANLIHIITSIMNEFYVPYKAVVYRLYELNYIPEETARILWGEKAISRSVIEAYSRQIAEEQKWGRLYTADNRKAINGLKELLDKAEESSSLPSEWLHAFYKKFDLSIEKLDQKLENSVQILDSEEDLNV